MVQGIQIHEIRSGGRGHHLAARYHRNCTGLGLDRQTRPRHERVSKTTIQLKHRID